MASGAGLLDWFGAGLLPVMPGTWGSLAALPCAWVIGRLWGAAGLAIAAAIVFAAGCWAAGTLARTSGVKDPGAIVIDEVAAQWVVLLPASSTPCPMLQPSCCSGSSTSGSPGRLDWPTVGVPGGLGIMLDDLLAAVYAVLVFVALLTAGGAIVVRS